MKILNTMKIHIYMWYYSLKIHNYHSSFKLLKITCNYNDKCVDMTSGFPSKFYD